MLICLDQRTGSGCGAQNRDGAQHCSKCGMLLRFALQLQNPGAVIGHYRIARVLGHGGFGAVYEAEDMQRPGLRVALKETFDPTSIGSYQKEFAVLRTLQHPNLPRYYEMFEYQGNGYLVMELVPGQSLEEVLYKQPGQPLLESQVLGYAIQLCDALTYLHSQVQPILHRDIKPANIRLTPEGWIKLVDFGLVKQGTGTTGSSQRGLTPAYAPIEQWGSLPGQHTGAYSDVYALGATMYHLLTAQAPMPATDRVSAPNDPLQPVHVVNPRVSTQVAQAIMNAMERFPKNRCASAALFKQMLFGMAPPPVSQNYAPTTMPVRPTTPHSPPVPMNRNSGWIAAVIGVFAIIGLGVWGANTFFKPSPTVVLVTPVTVVTPMPPAVAPRPTDVLPTPIPTVAPPTLVPPTVPPKPTAAPPTAVPKPTPSCVVVENFASMPRWNSTWEADWGSGSANFWVESGALHATRSGPGSSSKVVWYSVASYTTYDIQIYMNGTSGNGYWTEAAFKLGRNSAQDFDGNVSTWTFINKFDSEGLGSSNGTGGQWVLYHTQVNTGNATNISIGFKAGLYDWARNYPGGHWGGLTICPQ